MEADQLTKYFKAEGADPVLCNYIEQGYERLLEGHIVTEVDNVSTFKMSKLISSLGDKPFVLNENRFYFQRYYAYETDIINWIKDRIELNASIFNVQEKATLVSKNLIDKLFQPTEKLDWQRIGAINCFLNNFSIISGGPGTGKTRTVARFLCLYFTQKPLARVALVAQTGKAAARLKESLDNQYSDLERIMGIEFMLNFKSIEASTIHRILGRNQDSLGTVFHHNKEKPLTHDLIILDEASMIDLPLMAKLLTAISPKTTVVIMGDKNQLSSVEAGSVFGDLCDALSLNQFSNEKINVLNKLNSNLSSFQNDNNFAGIAVQFQKSFRFDENKGIGKFSKSILHESLLLEDYRRTLDSEEQGVQLVDDLTNEAFKSKLNYFGLYVQEKSIPKALKLLAKVKILTALKQGKKGYNEMNLQVEAYLEAQGLIEVAVGFYHNQPIMITQNDYSLNLFNGDVGLIRAEESGLHFYIEDSSQELGYRKFPVGFIRNYQTVYAMTVHKSQGSEFEHVIVVLPDDSASRILSRELIYTAVTRSSFQVLVVGTEHVIQASLSHKVERVSGIKERLIL